MVRNLSIENSRLHREPPLPIENRPAIGQFNDQGDQQHRNSKYCQSGHGASKIGKTFVHAGPAGERVCLINSLERSGHAILYRYSAAKRSRAVV